VDGLLSVPTLSEADHWDNMVRLASQGLDKLFADQPRDVIEARVVSYLERYLSRRFPPVETPRLDALASRLEKMAGKVKV
jgi:hypothetical protein